MQLACGFCPQTPGEKMLSGIPCGQPLCLGPRQLMGLGSSLSTYGRGPSRFHSCGQTGKPSCWWSAKTQAFGEGAESKTLCLLLVPVSGSCRAPIPGSSCQKWSQQRPRPLISQFKFSFMGPVGHRAGRPPPLPWLSVLCAAQVWLCNNEAVFSMRRFIQK